MTEPARVDSATTAEQQLSSMRRRLGSLVEKNRQLRHDIDAASRNNRRMVEMLDLTREQIATLKQSIEDAALPPFNFATVLQYHPARQAVEGTELAATTRASVDVLYNGRKLRTHLSPLLDAQQVVSGAEVLLDESLCVISVLGHTTTGELARVKEVLDDGLLLVVGRADDEHVMRRVHELADRPIRVGDAVTVDVKSGYVFDVVALSEVQDVVLEKVPNISYDDIGGLGDQIEMIRDAVELPFTHPDLYREHGLTPPKGVLLYGPPGTGKTLIAKAVANSLAQRGSGDRTAYFLNIKGPELLNKYVGETERHIRTLFARAREKASDGYPVVIFFDEMESLFRTRGSGTSSDVETTIVPQLLAEIDGVESLNNVIVIGASNREDMIDPAILRPGRLDVKIRVERPNEAEAREIFSKYVTAEVPLHPSELAVHGSREATVESMISTAAAYMYARGPQTEYVEVTYLDGSTQVLHFADFASGAAIANVVDRAKTHAIKEYLAAQDHHPQAAKGLKTQHLVRAVSEEFAEQQDLPNTSSPEEWVKISGHRGPRVVGLRMLCEASFLGDKNENARRVEEAVKANQAQQTTSANTTSAGE
ncbi:proteasome ATPase [Auritidibacter ignavus]|uniref:proteasome ATPase n=1 Tax=Auritidibacter ignavus TaxID=678932 RepID=UPI00244986BB|nr:proteasome ATPase [Auritidibacter ignavus]WGH84391.1 proteasome ATPase [Auritidibacter ignavus]